MIKNEIFFLSSLGDMEQSWKNNDHIFYVNIDGNKIADKEQYLDVIQTTFKFPSDCRGNLDAYNDWMTDLEWLPEQEIVLVILNFNNFMSNDYQNKDFILKSFEEIILPFWEEDVIHVMVGGKRRKFTVYLVS